MSQEYSFASLVNMRVIRLTRPQIPTLLSLQTSTIPEVPSVSMGIAEDIKGEGEEALCMNDVSEGNCEYSNMLLFPTSFG